MSDAPSPTAELQALAGLFYASVAEMGRFEEIAAGALPEPYHTLLDHDEHMTVTVEAHHGCGVDLQVLDTSVTATHHSRKVLLARQSDGRPVLMGIPRLNLGALGPDVRRAVERQDRPLGRVLIEHEVLRHVRLMSLWKVTPADDLKALFGLDGSQPCYGRTALIYLDGVLAVELLEIVPPV